ncbi:MAG: phage tail tape measure protein [Rhodospirillaceae bacterium]
MAKTFDIAVLLKLTDKLTPGLGKTSAAAKVAFAAMGAAAVAGIGSSVKAAADFESGMRNANTMMKLSEESFQDVKRAALDMAARVPVAIDDIPTAMFNISSAGLDAAKSLETIATAAVAGNTPLDQMVTLGAAVVNAFDDVAESDLPRVFDVTQAAMEKGVLTMQEMIPALGNIIPQAKGVGAGFEEAAAALSFVTTQGLSAAEAGTAVANVYKSLSERLGELQDAGVEVFDTMGNFRGLLPIMEDLNAKMQGLTDAEKQAQLEALNFDIRASKGIIAFTSNIEKARDVMGAVGDASGSVAAAMAEQMKDPTKAMELLRSQIEGIKINLGEALMPVVIKAVGHFSDLAEKVRALEPEDIERYAKLAAAIGGVVILGPKIVATTQALINMTAAVRGLAASGGLAKLVKLFPAAGATAGAGLAAGITAVGTAGTAAAGFIAHMAGVMDTESSRIEDFQAHFSDANIEALGKYADEISNISDGVRALSEDERQAAAEATGVWIPAVVDASDAVVKLDTSTRDAMAAASDAAESFDVLAFMVDKLRSNGLGLVATGPSIDSYFDTLADGARGAARSVRDGALAYEEFGAGATSALTGTMDTSNNASRIVVEGMRNMGSTARLQMGEIQRGTDTAVAAINDMANAIEGVAGDNAVSRWARGLGIIANALAGLGGVLGFESGGRVPEFSGGGRVEHFAAGGVSSGVPAIVHPGEGILTADVADAVVSQLSRGPMPKGRSGGARMTISRGGSGSGGTIINNFYGDVGMSEGDRIRHGNRTYENQRRADTARAA